MKGESWTWIASSLLALSLVACGGGDSEPAPGAMPFSNAIAYDHGYYPVVAGVEKTNVVIEMHEGTHSGLWYHVGTVDLANGAINWGPSTQWLAADGSGFWSNHPSVSVSDDCIVAEAHVHQTASQVEGDGSIWTTIGTADPGGNAMGWGPIQPIDSHGYFPSIVISRDGNAAVIVYQNDPKGGTLFYRVGTDDKAKNSIDWGPRYPFTQGTLPSIGMDELGNILEVHNSYQQNQELWYTVGKLDRATLTVNWGGTYGFNSAELGARVVLSDAGQHLAAGSSLVVFPGRDNRGDLWWDAGQPNPSNFMGNWGPSYSYNSGANPAVAYVYKGLWLEVHGSNVSDGNPKLWYSLVQP